MNASQQIARVAHEVNRAYCVAIGDLTQPSWELAPEWQRSSAVNGVEKIISGEVTNPVQSHQSWYDEKENQGWVYGPVKDPGKLQHPCMVPYEELPLSQRIKDFLFFAVVRSMA